MLPTKVINKDCHASFSNSATGSAVNRLLHRPLKQMFDKRGEDVKD